mgnify:CR=1 FL=1
MLIELNDCMLRVTKNFDAAGDLTSVSVDKLSLDSDGNETWTEAMGEYSSLLSTIDRTTLVEKSVKNDPKTGERFFSYVWKPMT